MDHFARPDDELALAQRKGQLHRNFQGYSTHADCDLLAFGISAIGKIGPTYSQNLRTLDEYYERIDADRLPAFRGYRLSAGRPAAARRHPGADVQLRASTSPRSGKPTASRSTAISARRSRRSGRWPRTAWSTCRHGASRSRRAAGCWCARLRWCSTASCAKHASRRATRVSSETGPRRVPRLGQALSARRGPGCRCGSAPCASRCPAARPTSRGGRGTPCRSGRTSSSSRPR